MAVRAGDGYLLSATTTEGARYLGAGCTKIVLLCLIKFTQTFV
jgi:hypothetical protein